MGSSFHCGLHVCKFFILLSISNVLRHAELGAGGAGVFFQFVFGCAQRFARDQRQRSLVIAAAHRKFRRTDAPGAFVPEEILHDAVFQWHLSHKDMETTPLNKAQVIQK